MIRNSHWHFVGIGGIGMSALAQFARALGCRVSGSDRGHGRPENARILEPLVRQGIRLYPQDGSFRRDGDPDVLIWSTAIEADNPDFVAAPELPRKHRSQALAQLIRESGAACSIAVTGSCGKSSVTAWLTEALVNLGENPRMVNGALSKRFRSPTAAGNFRDGDEKILVFEADESDKSLTAFAPDYAIVLNIGTDHYDRAELARVFTEFLRRVKRGAVLERNVYEAVRSGLPRSLEVAVFESEPGRSGEHAVTDCHCAEGRSRVTFSSGPEVYLLPQPGWHQALNALAIHTLLPLLGLEPSPQAFARFDGVWRRNDRAGFTPAGALVCDDYAHNPEKIVSAIRTARETVPGRIFAIFQPHGYGPFGFMREALLAQLEPVLRDGDEFLLLPPYYAGGTSSFRPTSEEVTADYRKRSRHHFDCFTDRGELAAYVLGKAGAGDEILIMGARDNSLSDFAAELAAKEPESSLA